MKSCSRCYAVISKQYKIKMLTPIDFGSIKTKNICFRCAKEVSKIIKLTHKIVEMK